MIVRCWGSRGSIAVSGKEYLKYGGDTSCVEVVSNSGDTIVIDAGTGIRALGNSLINEKRLKLSILLTHAHWDHLSGFPFFKPLYLKESVVDVRGPRTTQDSVKTMVSKTMAPPNFPIELEDIHASMEFHSTGPERFRIGSINVQTIHINHTNIGVGFRFEEDGKSFVFLTDNELAHPHPSGQSFDEYARFSEGADLLFHDAEFTPEDYKHTKGWGHSVYLDTVKVALQAGVAELGLFHHNQDRVDAEVDKIVKDSKRVIKENSSKLKCFGVASGSERTL